MSSVLPRTARGRPATARRSPSGRAGGPRRKTRRMTVRAADAGTMTMRTTTIDQGRGDAAAPTTACPRSSRTRTARPWPPTTAASSPSSPAGLILGPIALILGIMGLQYVKRRPDCARHRARLGRHHPGVARDPGPPGVHHLCGGWDRHLETLGHWRAVTWLLPSWHSTLAVPTSRRPTAAAARARGRSPCGRNPAGLADALRDLLRGWPPYDRLAVTMTGELCDCFATKREGVLAILDAVECRRRLDAGRVWRNDGRLVDFAAARAAPLAGGGSELAGPGDVRRPLRPARAGAAHRHRLDHDRHRPPARRPAGAARAGPTRNGCAAASWSTPA